MPSPLLFVFDMDDVLYDYDWRHRMAGMTALTGLELGELRRRWWHEDGEWAAEAGRWRTGAEYLGAVNASLGSHLSVDEWIANRKSAMTPWPESIAAVRRASELGAVSLLTNNGSLVGEHLAIVAPELAEIIPADDLRTSSWYGARKPDVEVFENLLRSYDRDAERVFFADDLPQNVAGAASVGISAHLFTSSAALLAAVEDFAATRA